MTKHNDDNEGMDKYGVDESSADLAKLAAEGCPHCGEHKLEKHGSVIVCPKCGSEPFEGGK
jgi:uncharacterized Zn finger protein (UPF0148 family)